MPKVLVDMDTCINSGMCASLAPTVFEMDQDARLVVIEANPDDAAQLELVNNAVACCPVEAIRLEE